MNVKKRSMQTIADRKLNTIASIAQLENEEMLSFIEQLLTKQGSVDWATTLSPEERSDLEEGLADMEAGRTVDYDPVKNQNENGLSLYQI